MAYYELEPFGEDRADLRSGIVASTIANVNRNPKKRRKAFTASEFMPDFEKERAPASPETLLAKVEMLNAAFGGRDLRKKR